MTSQFKNTMTIFSVIAVVVCYFSASSLARDPSTPSTTAPAQSSPTPEDLKERENWIYQREQNRKGISIDQVRVYDDAMLQRMLQAAEARLASLQLIDQSQILSRLGAISGASQTVSGIGVNVQGAPIPGVVTTTKLPTQTTTETTAAGATASGLSTVSGSAVEDVQTTRPVFNPPASTAPAPTTTMPSSGFSVASSDILSEQMQLTAEINGLRLMLAGDLSGHFINPKSGLGEGVSKLKTTLGFPITISPDARYKDAVAIVEVEISNPPPKDDVEAQRENPMITTLLPREKTYNVASISENNISLGGGIATQVIGVSGSWFRGHKTYYVVQDQDTVAKTFHAGESKVGFTWEFRPVLGRRYVRSGLKQTFVQVAFPAPLNAKEGRIGTVTMRTYWRKYDQKRGVLKEVIKGSLSIDTKFVIPGFSLAVRPTALLAEDIEDIGSGQVLVSLKNRFLPGAYVRIGSKIISTSSGLLYEHNAIRFSAPIADVALRDAYLVAHDGNEVPIALKTCGEIEGPTGVFTHIQFVPKGDPTIKILDDSSSLVTVDFEKRVTPPGGTTEIKTPTRADLNGLVLVVGQRAFGYSQLQAQCDAKGNCTQLSAVVPNSGLNARTELSIQTVLPNTNCASTPISLARFVPAPTRLSVLERGAAATTFLLSGNRLKDVTVLSPSGTQLSEIGEDPDSLRKLTLTAANLASNKQVLMIRDNKTFLVPIPDLEVKKPEPPKAQESITTNSDEAIIIGDGLSEVEAVTIRGQAVGFEVLDRNTLRLSRLKAVDATRWPSTQTVILQFKNGTKASVALKIVDSKIEVVEKN